MADLTKERELIASLQEQGIDNPYIVGCDEAGRGAFAGPLVAAAVVLPQDADLSEINDSKKISKRRHIALSQKIMETALAIGIGIVDVDYIDRFGVGQANKKAIEEAVADLPITPSHLLIDGSTQQVITSDIPQTQLIKGDSISLSVASASIIAKTVHDVIMRQLHEQYPDYSWNTNTGYGTQAHIEAIHTFGLTDHHRRSVKPIKEYLKKMQLTGGIA